MCLFSSFKLTELRLIGGYLWKLNFYAAIKVNLLLFFFPGLIFDTPYLEPVTGGPVLEVTGNNELVITAEFPLVNNEARASKLVIT